MGNKLLRNSVSVLVIAVMAMTAFAVPSLSNSDKVFGKTKDAKLEVIDSGTYSAEDDSTKVKGSNPNNCKINMPATGRVNKQIIFSIRGDGQDRYGSTTPTQDDEIYLPQYVALYSGSSKISSTTLTDASYPYNLSMEFYKTGTFKVEATFFPYKYNGSNWYYDNSKSTVVKSQNITIKALVSYNKNKGKFKKTPATKLLVYGSKYGSLPGMKKRSGHKFAGWYTSKTGGSKVTASSTFKYQYDITLYAQWKYKLTLNGNKGKIGKKSKKTKTVTSGQKYGKLTNAKRSGYNFVGWFTKKKGGSFTKSSTYNNKQSKHTLYAHWVKKSSYATKSQYKAIKKNMTYKDAKRIFGRASKETAYTQGMTIKVWYAKKIKDFGYYKRHTGPVIAFYNGKVVGKGWFNGVGTPSIKLLDYNMSALDANDLNSINAEITELF